MWISFCYERLSTFCYLRSFLSHEKEDFDKVDNLNPYHGIKFGPGLRAGSETESPISKITNDAYLLRSHTENDPRDRRKCALTTEQKVQSETEEGASEPLDAPSIVQPQPILLIYTEQSSQKEAIEPFQFVAANQSKKTYMRRPMLKKRVGSSSSRSTPPLPSMARFREALANFDKISPTFL